MRGTFHGIEIGRTGINMGQLGLDITGHNIANVNTRGFTRQRVVQTANDPNATMGMVRPTAAAFVGSGTRVQVHDQIRSEFLDRRFRTENTSATFWETRTQELRSLESFFDNVNELTSINASLGRFFSAISASAADPVAGPPRGEIRSSALVMIDQLQQVHVGLVELQRNQDRAVVGRVDQINEIAQKIAGLNESIYAFELRGHVANDLRDARNLLLDDLSSIVDIDYEERTDMHVNNVLTVRIGGEVLVHHDNHGRLSTGTKEVHDGSGSGLDTVQIPVWESVVEIAVDGQGNLRHGFSRVSAPRDGHEDLVLNSGRGSLAALVEMRDSTNPLRPGIPASIESLNNLVRALVQQVNEIHRQGFNDHPFHDSTNGINLFHEDPSWGFVRRSGDPLETFTLIAERALDAGGNPVLDAQGNPTYTGYFVDPTDSSIRFASVLDAQNAGFSRDLSGLHIGNFRLSDEVMESEYNIAASTKQIIRNGNPDDLQSGNNLNMNQLVLLFGRNNLFFEGADERIAFGSFDDFATRIRQAVASTTHVSRHSAETSRNLTLSAENQRLSIGGVSLDEEMTHMIRFNHAYNGAARVITAMDDALDRLINGTGRVGL